MYTNCLLIKWLYLLVKLAQKPPSSIFVIQKSTINVSELHTEFCFFYPIKINKPINDAIQFYQLFLGFCRTDTRFDIG